MCLNCKFPVNLKFYFKINTVVSRFAGGPLKWPKMHGKWNCTVNRETEYMCFYYYIYTVKQQRNGKTKNQIIYNSINSSRAVIPGRGGHVPPPVFFAGKVLQIRSTITNSQNFRLRRAVLVRYILYLTLINLIAGNSVPNSIKNRKSQKKIKCDRVVWRPCHVNRVWNLDSWNW